MSKEFSCSVSWVVWAVDFGFYASFLANSGDLPDADTGVAIGVGAAW